MFKSCLFWRHFFSKTERLSDLNAKSILYVLLLKCARNSILCIVSVRFWHNFKKFMFQVETRLFIWHMKRQIPDTINYTSSVCINHQYLFPHHLKCVWVWGLGAKKEPLFLCQAWAIWLQRFGRLLGSRSRSRSLYPLIAFNWN